MKIAYVALLSERRIGIESHILARARAARRIGVDIDFIVIGPTASEAFDLVRYVPYPAPLLSVKYARSVFGRYRIIAQQVSLQRYDRVVLRYPGGDPTGPHFAEQYPIITEHHTNEESEFQSKFNSGLPMLEAFMKRLRHGMELRYGPAVINGCRGILAMTEEIEQFERQRVLRAPASAVVSNGVDVQTVAASGFKAFDGNRLDIAFVAATIDPARAPWHGLDRILAGLERYQGSVNINLHLIGKPSAGIVPRKIRNSTILCHGARSGHALDDILGDMNLGISTMALHRKGMRQACPFKSREYMARGLPFLTAHDDPDVLELDSGRRYFRRFPSDDDAIEMNEVVEFASELAETGSPDSLAAEMRAAALARIDWGIKIKQMVDFVKEV